MNWSKKQVAHYYRLLKRLAGVESWKDIGSICFADFTAPGPAESRQIRRVEKKLGGELPKSLRDIYLECGGMSGNYKTALVMPLDELLWKNEWFRRAESIGELYMPFDNLLLFGEAGNGDLFAFPIAIDGSYGTENIYEWNHENDSRTWKASGIKDLLARLATDWSE